jgi:hypothetical protein
MGLAIPRPAMRSREERIVRLKLTYHALMTGDLVAKGHEPAEASRLAATLTRKHSFDALDRRLQVAKKEIKGMTRREQARYRAIVNQLSKMSRNGWDRASHPDYEPLEKELAELAEKMVS